MTGVAEYIDSQLARGRAYFLKSQALEHLRIAPAALQGALSRLQEKGRLVSPRQGFYLIVRPEDRVLGAPDPARWIAPLMNFLRLDYRVSLLRAAAFHGAGHQAAMAFQVVTSRQLRNLEIGRQRVEFVYQSPARFQKTNRPEWLERMKTDAGYAQVAGVELTLLDICRYFHRAGGINAAAQAVHDLGRKANPRRLARAATAYENSAVRRLGYLLQRFDHVLQARALRAAGDRAKSYKELDPSAQAVTAELRDEVREDRQWKLAINVPVEIDV